MAIEAPLSIVIIGDGDLLGFELYTEELNCLVCGSRYVVGSVIRWWRGADEGQLREGDDVREVMGSLVCDFHACRR